MEEGDRVTKRELADVQLILSAARKLVQLGSQVSGTSTYNFKEKSSLASNLMQALLYIALQKYVLLLQAVSLH